MGLGHDVAENTDTIGGRISLAREALELSNAQAAEAICVCVDVWSDWERDRSAPPPRLLEPIAQSLQVTLYWLLTGRGVGPTWRDLLEIAPDAPLPCWHAGVRSSLADIFLRPERLTARR